MNANETEGLTQDEESIPFLPNAPTGAQEFSFQLDKLAAALALAQGEMQNATKEASNPFFKSKYADLASVWDSCRGPLSKNGLSVVQTIVQPKGDLIVVSTLLLHSSGQWIRGFLGAKPLKTDPQAIGSCITYLRRYSLQSIVGIAAEDDDGNKASDRETKPWKTAVAQAQTEAEPVIEADRGKTETPAAAKQIDALSTELVELYKNAAFTEKQRHDLQVWLSEGHTALTLKTSILKAKDKIRQAEGALKSIEPGDEIPPEYRIKKNQKPGDEMVQRRLGD